MNAIWLTVEEVSLTSEGLAQWVAYRWLTSRRGLPPALVRTKLRNHSWSHDQGLAIFLAIDRLAPDWQKRLLANEPELVEQLLTKACSD